jgi:hypothetical protein
MGFYSGVVWRPFSSRFSQLLGRMKTHKTLFDQEMHLDDQRELTTHLTALQQYLKESDARAEKDKRKEQAQEEEKAGK